jgi:site-specific DNA-cytosine methylase
VEQGQFRSSTSSPALVASAKGFLHVRTIVAAQYTQLGNAVPRLLANQIAKVVRDLVVNGNEGDSGRSLAKMV